MTAAVQRLINDLQIELLGYSIRRLSCARSLWSGAQRSGRRLRTVTSMCRSFRTLILIASLTGILSGCAVYTAYEKCGLYGCADDAKITADIKARFSKRLDLEPNVITVQTLDHVVYLYGVVSSSLEISTAESIAPNVPGVTGVVSSVGAQTR